MRSEYLGGNRTVFTSENHKFGTDALLLADFAEPRKTDVACDLGTGCGIIPLLWCRGISPKEITAVDIQTEAVELVKKAIEENKLQERLHVVCADLKELKGVLPFNHFNLVTMNPPYKALTAGIKSENRAANTARFETDCTVKDITASAFKLLKSSGRLCMCQRPERLTDIITAMRESKIEPKRLQLVCHRKGSAPSLILIEGKKGAKPGLTILPPLFIEDDTGEHTKEIMKIYAQWRQDNG